jgi:large subunit ribosomal protein L25
MTESSLTLETRQQIGSQYARKCRREGKVPGVFYFHGQQNTLFTVGKKELLAFIGREATLIDVNFDGKTNKKCIVRDIQYDPIDSSPLHVDLMGIMLTEKIHVSVSIHLIGTPDGVKNQGGILQQVLREVEIECLPTEIPDHFEIDVSKLDIGGSVHLSDIQTPNIKLLGEITRVIATVSAPKITEEKVVTEEVQTAEPELISKRPEKEEEA